MRASQLALLERLAVGGQGANVLASVITLLVIEGVQLGALEEIPAIGADGNRRTIFVLPREWIDRLAHAIELGVFEKPTQKTMRKVVDRILAPPLPADGETNTV